jgi:EamA domain-containing membrane protein RarD
VNHCKAMNTGLEVSCVLTAASTTFIFLQRIRAVYSQDYWVQTLAILLWLGTCSTTAFTSFQAQSTRIPGTQICTYNIDHPALLANVAVFLGFDTFAFFAISYKIAASHLDSEAGITWGSAISGKALPRISQTILRGGQQYYLYVYLPYD